MLGMSNASVKSCLRAFGILRLNARILKNQPPEKSLLAFGIQEFQLLECWIVLEHFRNDLVGLWELFGEFIIFPRQEFSEFL